MPAYYIEHPLSVHFHFPDGTEWLGKFGGTPNDLLAQDLAMGLASLAHPHGTIASKSSAEVHAVSLRRMVEDTFDLGFRGGAKDLTRDVVLQHWLSRPHSHERNTRALLRGFDSETGQLAPALRRHLSSRQIHTRPATEPYKPYTRSEWERLEKACSAIVTESWSAHKRVTELAQQALDRTGGTALTVEQLVASHLIAAGPATAHDVQREFKSRGLSVSGSMVVTIRRALFVDIEAQIAYRLLFGMLTGVVSDGIDGMKLEDISWTSPQVAVIRYVKGRTGPEGLTLSKRASKLLQQWLAHSEPLRRHCTSRRRAGVWIVSGTKAQADRVAGLAKFALHSRKITKKHHLKDDDGADLQIHRGRVRVTYISLMASRKWTGRTTIDPNHTAGVEGHHYLASIGQTHELLLAQVVEEAQADMLRKGFPLNVLTDEDLAQAAHNMTDSVKVHLSSESALETFLSGEQDVFLASCANQLASPFGVKGKACAARVWVCLLCPLAVFLPRHAANLLELKAFFARQSLQLPVREFMRIYGPYAIRLDQEILPRFNAKVLEAASMAVTDRDQALPLRPEEATQ